MTKQLIINNVEYFPTAVLASRFDYSSDYLSRLAREKKIVATRVGRSWFISEASLLEYQAVSEQEKVARQAALRQERLQEQKSQVSVAQPAPVVAERQSLVSPLIAVTQSVVVIMCGLLVGGLGFMAVEEDVQPAALLSVGVSAATTVEQQAHLPLTLMREWFDWFGGRYASEETIVPQEPTWGPAVVERPSVRTQLGSSFSDDIEVFFDEAGVAHIRPVFVEGTDEVYEFTINPIAQTDK